MISYCSSTAPGTIAAPLDGNFIFLKFLLDQVQAVFDLGTVLHFQQFRLDEEDQLIFGIGLSNFNRLDDFRFFCGSDLGDDGWLENLDFSVMVPLFFSL